MLAFLAGGGGGVAIVRAVPACRALCVSACRADGVATAWREASIPRHDKALKKREAVYGLISIVGDVGLVKRK